MHQPINHDTSSQAMTEVALGLSMAFFSLLILALFSIGLPEQNPQKTPVQEAQSPSSIDEKLKLVGSTNKTSESKPNKPTQQQYVFYFNGRFYDKQLIELNTQALTELNTQQPIVLAVPDSLPLAKVMAARKQIKHPNTSITVLNQSWQGQLEKMQ
jgi:hypothetical protein